jgi:60 kDa SS-A/Ro ribonucleoprotein
MMAYLRNFLETPTPQNEELDDRQVQNDAGGYVYPVDNAVQMERFLILGAEGGSFYADERKMVKENAKATTQYIREHGPEAVAKILEISTNRRARRESEALYCLAIAASDDNTETRQLAFTALPEIARTASYLYEFVSYVLSMRGWGHALRHAIADWYESKSLSWMVYQSVKYRQRYGWTHRDLLRKAHPKTPTDLNHLYAWITHDTAPPATQEFGLIHAFREAQQTEDVKEVVRLIHEFRLPWEAVPTTMLAHKEVWQALGPYMPDTALIRNLATLTVNQAIAPMDAGWAVDKLDRVKGVHPLQILTAMRIYEAGRDPDRPGRKSRSTTERRTWTPVAQVMDALDRAFNKSFLEAPQTNKRLYIAVDVSGSMDWTNINGIRNFTPRMGAAALALAIAKREPNYYVMGFSSSPGRDPQIPEMTPLGFTAADTFAAAVSKTAGVRAGGTDCSMPMLDALQKRIPVDAFVILTDNQTWAGRMHPAEALRLYRRQMGISAKLIVIGMVANKFSVADPNDAGMLDIAGFDAAMPQLISGFVQGTQVQHVAQSDYASLELIDPQTYYVVDEDQDDEG